MPEDSGDPAAQGDQEALSRSRKIETLVDAAQEISTTRILRLAVPVMLANLAQPLMSAVDTAISGHLPSEAALGGVAVGGLFFNFVFWSFGFLRMTTTGLVAQAVGAADRNEERAVWLRALLLGLALGLLILLVQAPLIAIAPPLIGGSAAVREAASRYVQARIWSAPATLGNYVILGVLLGRQRPGLALALQLLVNILNAAAAALIVYGLHQGVAGLGAATAAADWATFGAGLLLVRRRDEVALPPVDWLQVFNRAALLRLFVVNRDVFLRTLCLIGGFGWFAHEGALLGDTVLAANALLLNFQLFMSAALDGFAQAAEMLVGAAIGRGDRAAFRAALRQSSACAAILAAVIGTSYALGAARLIDVLTDRDSVRAAAQQMLGWVCISPVISVWCFMLDGVFIGATRGRELRDSTAIALASFVAATWLLRPPLGNHGLWLAFLVFMAVRGICLALWLPRIGIVARSPAVAVPLGA